MGCGGSTPVDGKPNPLVKVSSIDTGVLTAAEAGRTTLVDGQIALVVGGLGVAVLDVSDPKRTVNTGVQTREGGGRITLIPNSSVAIVTGGYGLAILDFSDPPNTKKLKAINTGVLTVDEAGRCTIVDDKTALVVGGLGVAVLDISDPQNVSKLKKVDSSRLCPHAHETHGPIARAPQLHTPHLFRWTPACARARRAGGSRSSPTAVSRS